MINRYYVGSEIAKNYKLYKTLKEAKAALKMCGNGCYITRIHNIYNRNLFYGYKING